MMPVPTLENPKEGRDRLKKIISEWKPSVVLLNYGAEVALSAGRAWTDEASASKRSAGDWDESVAVFLEGYAQMIQEIRKNAGEGLREIVVVTPPPLENLGRPLPDHQGIQPQNGQGAGCPSRVCQGKQGPLCRSFRRYGRGQV